MSDGDKNVEFRIICEWKNAHEDTICSYLFVDDRDLLLTASYDDSVKIWKLSRSNSSGKIDFQKEPKLLKKIFQDFRDEDPNLLLRWDDSTFLTGTDDGTVISYSLDYPFDRKKFFDILEMINYYGQQSLKRDDIHGPFPVSRDTMEVMVLSVSKVQCLKYHGQKIPSNQNQDFVVLCKCHPKRRNNTRDINNFFSVISYSEEKILYHHEIPRKKFDIASYSKHTSSKSVPNAIFLQTGARLMSYNSSLRRSEFDNSVLMMDIVSGEILGVYQERPSYDFDNFLDKNGKEFLVCEGSSSLMFLCDVETKQILKFFSTSFAFSYFLRLGNRHYIVGEDDHSIDLVNVFEPKEEDLQNSEDDENGVKTYKPDRMFASSGIDYDGEEFNCLCLLTNLRKGKMNQYQEGDEIVVIAYSSSGDQYIIGIKNLEVELLEEDENVQKEQSLKDMQERLEYLLFDENRYVGEREEFTLFVSGQVVLKHSILRLLLFVEARVTD